MKYTRTKEHKLEQSLSAKKRWAERTPEQREQIINNIKLGIKKRTPEEKVEISRKIKAARARQVITEEHKKKISKKLKGRKLPPFTEEHKKNIGRTSKGRFVSLETREKISKAGRGRIPSEETRMKLSEAHRGEKCYAWKGGITPENNRVRNSIQMRLWREAVFTRDDYICQKYRIKGGKLKAHHIQNFAQYPELRFAIDNGITFSEEAHQKFHQIYGIKNNTREQVEEFLDR